MITVTDLFCGRCSVSIPDRRPLGAPCRHCGSWNTWIEWRVEAKPLGSHSLSGTQLKVSATTWPYAVCDGCGHESRGEPA